MSVAVPITSYRAAATGGAITALVLAAASTVGPVALAIVLVAVQVLVTLAWLAAMDTPAAVEAFAIVGIAAVAANVLAARDNGYGIGDTVSVVAVGFLASLLVQLRRPAPRARVVESIGVATTGCLIVVLAAHLVAVAATRSGSGVAAVVCLTLGVTQLVGRLIDAAVPRPALVTGSGVGVVGAFASCAAATLTGALLGNVVGPLSARSGALLAFIVAVTAIAVTAFVDLAHHDVGSDRQRAALRPLAALLPFTAAAPVAYAATRLLIA